MLCLIGFEEYSRWVPLKTFWFSVIYSYVSKTLHLQQLKRTQSSKLGM